VCGRLAVDLDRLGFNDRKFLPLSELVRQQTPPTRGAGPPAGGRGSARRTLWNFDNPALTHHQPTLRARVPGRPQGSIAIARSGAPPHSPGRGSSTKLGSTSGQATTKMVPVVTPDRPSQDMVDRFEAMFGPARRRAEAVAHQPSA
jgi:hypothetical protein